MLLTMGLRWPNYFRLMATLSSLEILFWSGMELPGAGRGETTSRNEDPLAAVRTDLASQRPSDQNRSSGIKFS